MAALQASSLLIPSSSSGSPSKRRVSASIHVPKLPKLRLSDASSAMTRKLVEEFSNRNGYTITEPLQMEVVEKVSPSERRRSPSRSPTSSVETTTKLYAILEAVEDRVEMHDNIGKQRDNWNKLLLNSVNMMTLTATTTAAMAAAVPAPSLRACSTLLFTAATGMSLLQSEIKSMLVQQSPTESDVKETMEKVLALDRAFPLALLGKMIEKFPAKFEPAVWWPMVSGHHRQSQGHKTFANTERNGWSEELAVEMRAIVQVLKSKDKKDYLRLGNLALKLNKTLAVLGPLLTGIAAATSTYGGSTATTVAAIAGAMAAITNGFEHGAQVGMVVEMYRNNAGFFKLMEETIEATLEERDYDKREKAEMFEMKVAMKLGRSLSQLRDLARKSMASCLQGTEVDEFGSKLF
ncbi:hypothetical protein ACJRO7_021964 [Eucalyptus globulus]|uniref:F-box protein At4g22030 n=1 Tax=Eucalyptus globulus TaxID=34317 RepID=A0ABD3KP20_EUCGL